MLSMSLPATSIIFSGAGGELSQIIDGIKLALVIRNNNGRIINENSLVETKPFNNYLRVKTSWHNMKSCKFHNSNEKQVC